MIRHLEIENELREYLEVKVFNRRTPIIEGFISFEDLLFDFLSNKIIEIYSEKNNVLKLETKKYSFIYKIHPFEIRFAEEKLDKSGLVCTILRLDHKQNNIFIKKISLPVFIKYSFFELIVDNELVSEFDNIAYFLTLAINFAYTWLYEKIQFLLDKISSSCVNALYSEIRKNFNKVLGENIILYALYQSGGIYLMDRITRERIFNKITSDFTLHSSPLESLIELNTRILPPNVVTSTDAIRARNPIVLSFSNAKYSSSGLQIAEEITFNCEKIIVHPLVYEKKSYLVAGYPIELRQHIEKKLDLLKYTFLKIINENKSNLINSVNRIKSVNNSQFYQNLGSFSGSFIKSLLESS
jgi:hypothetical protein